jgi:hypothetical protein
MAFQSKIHISNFFSSMGVAISSAQSPAGLSGDFTCPFSASVEVAFAGVKGALV